MKMLAYPCGSVVRGMENKLSIDTVRCALRLAPPDFDPHQAQRKMALLPRPVKRPDSRDGQPRLAATLLLLYPVNERLYFVLTRRPDTFTNHAGQISLPGGRREDHESFEQTALRETCEEIGICGSEIELLGALTELYIPPSDFQVNPFVGYIPYRPEWKYSEIEVAEIIECPLDLLLDDSLKQRGLAEIRGATFEICWYQIEKHRVWGATAIMLSELEWRLRACL